MVGGDQGQFLTSVQSSLTSTKGNETWWTMLAWQNGTGKSDYEVHGTMVKDVNSTIGEERNQLSVVWEVGRSSRKMVRGNNKLEPLGEDKDGEDEDGKDDEEKSNPCAKGTKQLLRWRHRKNTTTFKGQVGAQQAEVVVTGIVVLTLGSTNMTDDGHDSDERGDRLVRRQDTQEMYYTLSFSGNHWSESAPLPMQGLDWKQRGSGPPMKPFQFFTVELPKALDVTSTTNNPTSSTPTDTETSIPPFPTNFPIIPTHKPGDQVNHGGPPSKSPLPHGAIVGIAVGGVAAAISFIAMLFLLKRWRAKRKEPKVYPELAYIYSTPFTSANKRAVGDTGASSATAVAPGGASAHHGDREAETYYGPVAPQLEVDLGDQAPFLPVATATGSPGRLRGGNSDIGTASRAEEREEMEREMRQPMLSGAGTHREESPVRSRGEDFRGKY